MIQPYLFFSGRLDEAIGVYRDALGLEVVHLLRYRESPTPLAPGTLAPGFEDKVMHATLRIGSDLISASDGCDDQSRFQGFALRLELPTEDQIDRAFAALAVGGQVSMPLGSTFWSKKFGMLTDRFGLTWMISLKE